MDTTARKCRAAEVIASKEGGGILRVGQWDVDEDTLEDDEHGAGVDDDADDGDDPMDIGRCRPTEQEKTDGRAEDSEKCGLQA